MHVRCAEARKLRNVAAHVLPVGIEPGRLAERVKYPAGARVVARARDPLPVARVAGHVAVGEQCSEVPVAVPPVDAKRPGEERRGDHPRPVVHESLGGELPQAGVDDRDAGAARLPRGQRVGVLGPVPRPPRARPVIGRGDVREGGRDLVKEVTPGQLPTELLAARPRPRRPREGERGNAAEPQVGAQPGRLVAGQVVPLVAVALERSVQPDAGQVAPRSLTAGGETGRATRRPRREVARLDPRRHGKGSRRLAGLPPGRGAPGAPVGREDPVVIPAGRPDVSGGHDRVARRHRKRDPVAGALPCQPLLTSRRVPGDVAGDEDGDRPRLRGHADHLGDWLAPADHQVAAERAQFFPQRRHRLGEEPRPVRRHGQRRVHDEERHHLTAARAGVGQRRVVVNSQVTGEEHDSGVHHSPWVCPFMARSAGGAAEGG